ncbi:MAG: hypothetical protein P1U64_13165 [Alcanivoracaceae bacterium]|nr:hypothetical protein [Alcanivoracaceae bacterium]
MLAEIMLVLIFFALLLVLKAVTRVELVLSSHLGSFAHAIDNAAERQTAANRAKKEFQEVMILKASDIENTLSDIGYVAELQLKYRFQAEHESEMEERHSDTRRRNS